MENPMPDLRTEARDPLSPEALFLPHEAALEARRLYSETLLLETGNRQHPAMALYESYGFTPDPAFRPIC
jgi:ribosomal protein S18 acetylase RimI-like enzyme